MRERGIGAHLGKEGRVAAGVLTVLILSAVFARFVAPYDPIAQPDVIALKSLAPSLAHPFGTDTFSRDVLSRAIYGARVSLLVAFVATLVATTVGTAMGAIAGYAGGLIDGAIMRLVDAMLAIPRVILLIAIMALWRSVPLPMLVVIIGATGWFSLSRLVRAQVATLKHEEFVVAARALGASGPRVVLKHILPNVVPTVIVAAALGVGQVILLEAGLSYLGLGVQPPQASWGNIIYDGAEQIGTLWWISFFPGLLIVVTSIAFNSLGDALRDWLDPRGAASESPTGIGR